MHVKIEPLGASAADANAIMSQYITFRASMLFSFDLYCDFSAGHEYFKVLRFAETRRYSGVVAGALTLDFQGYSIGSNV